MFNDPHWPRAGHWLAENDSAAPIELVGVPLNRSISPGCTDQAPQAVREALLMWTPGFENETGIHAPSEVFDRGDVVLGDPDPEGRFPAISAQLHFGEKRRILVGGDNGVSYYGVRSLGHELIDVGVIQFDAHHDVRSLDQGFHNGNPYRALIEEGLPGENICQIGLQNFTNSTYYSGWAKGRGIQRVYAESVFDLKEFQLALERVLRDLRTRTKAIYVDFDLDVMDRSFAPGCPGSRPGGLSPVHLRWAARRLGRERTVRAIDLVELDPTLDINKQTTLTAASLILEFAGGHSEQ